MADALPKLDRARLRERLLVEFERVVEEVSDAIDEAPAGRVIRDSEEKARDTLDRFRQVVYPEFRARSWQIGSGPTEAECKTTTQRVKGRGRRWDAANAEAMMALAALHDSGLWHQRWINLDPQRN